MAQRLEQRPELAVGQAAEGRDARLVHLPLLHQRRCAAPAGEADVDGHPDVERAAAPGGGGGVPGAGPAGGDVLVTPVDAGHDDRPVLQAGEVIDDDRLLGGHLPTRLYGTFRATRATERENPAQVGNVSDRFPDLAASNVRASR